MASWRAYAENIDPLDHHGLRGHNLERAPGHVWQQFLPCPPPGFGFARRTHRPPSSEDAEGVLRLVAMMKSKETDLRPKIEIPWLQIELSCLEPYGYHLETVKVQFDFSFVDKDEKQLPSDIHEIEVTNFSKESLSWGYNTFMKRDKLEKSAYLKDDGLIIKCDIVVTKDANVDRTRANTIVVVPASDVNQHLSSLLQSTDGSNVTFEISEEIFAAHRCVLACRSTVFKGQLLGSMNEGTTAGVVLIDNMEARVFKLLLGFIYSESVPEMEEEDNNVTWQHFFVAADRYDLLRLRLICEQKLCTYINTTTAATILALAERHDAQGLKDACLDFLIRARANLQGVMVLGGLDHLASTYPLVLKELIAKLVSPSKKARIDVNASFVVVPQSGEGTDVVFEVSREKLNAHRCVLAARSAVFRAELFGPMKEGTTTGVIRIDDMEAKVFKLLLTFIYGDSMPDINEDEEYANEEDMEEEDRDDV